MSEQVNTPIPYCYLLEPVNLPCFYLHQTSQSDSEAQQQVFTDTVQSIDRYSVFLFITIHF